MAKKAHRAAERRRPRKTEVFSYKRNYNLGIGMIIFTFAWIVLIAPILATPGPFRIAGYIMLALVSIFNWTMIMQALRLVPWAPKQVELTRDEVIFRTIAGKERTVMKRVTRIRVQKNPIFIFSRGLMVFGEDSQGKLLRENVFFGDLGKPRLMELKEELERYK